MNKQHFHALYWQAALIPIIIIMSSSLAYAATITGAGSTAAEPVYKAWAKALDVKENFQLNYEAIGSSAGVKKIRNKEVSFGASDIAPSQAELDKDGLVLIPTFVSGIVPIVNLPKSVNEKLRLSGDVLADIFLGKITHWNAPQIQSLNPGVKLPALVIKPVVRSDGSGSTYYFTEYLSKLSPEWAATYGAKSQLKWPESFSAVKGSEGMADSVKSTTGTIGYIDFTNLQTMQLNPVALRNQTGQFVEPSVMGFKQALLSSEWFISGNFQGSLSNQAGRYAWPITMSSFILLPKVSDNTETTSLALKFFVWYLIKGDTIVQDLNFVRLPDKIQAIAFSTLSRIKDSKGNVLVTDVMTKMAR